MNFMIRASLPKILIAGLLLVSIPSFVEAQTVTVGPTSAFLLWTIPTTNTDGSPLTDLAGFYIFYGSSPSSLTNIIPIANPRQNSYMVNNLANGTWYFVVTAYTTQGTQNAPSNVVSKSIPAATVTVPTVIPSPPTNVTLTAQ